MEPKAGPWCPSGMATRFAAALVLVVVTVGGFAHAEPHTHPAASAILIDPAASPYRVHVAKMGEVRLVPGGALSGSGGHPLDRLHEVPVVEEAATQTRILFEHDDARMMLWIDNTALTWSLVRPVQVTGRGDAGIWLGTGAPVTVGGPGPRRAITYADRAVTIKGTADADAIARVFPASDDVESYLGTSAPDIRIAIGGPLIYRRPLPVDVMSKRGAWTEVEYRTRYVRIRGWVAGARIKTDLSIDSGTGGGSAIGMSDTDLIDIPAGACLHDRVGGQVVGIESAPQRRYVAGHDGDWWQVYVLTPWGTVHAWAHSLGKDPTGAPLWARCLPDGAKLLPFADD